MSGPGHDHAQEKVPLPFLIAAGLLVGTTLFLVGMNQHFKSEVGDLKAKAIIVQELRFEDEANGAIAVYAEPEGVRVETVEPGTNGFLRGTLRALARERRLNGIRDARPFRVARRADGSLTLDDPATGRSINLDAFGPVNSGVFASLLISGSKQQ
jgi:putative photosynthetic complex assembly protein